MSRLQAIPHVRKIKQVQENSKLRGDMRATWKISEGEQSKKGQDFD